MFVYLWHCKNYFFDVLIVTIFQSDYFLIIKAFEKQVFIFLKIARTKVFSFDYLNMFKI